MVISDGLRSTLIRLGEHAPRPPYSTVHYGHSQLRTIYMPTNLHSMPPPSSISGFAPAPTGTLHSAGLQSLLHIRAPLSFFLG